MDELDYAQKNIEQTAELAVKKASKLAQSMPRGKEGDCDLCGCWSSRIVYGACAPCRDKYRMG